MLDIYLVQYGFVLKQLQVFESLGTQRTQNNVTKTSQCLQFAHTQHKYCLFKSNGKKQETFESHACPSVKIFELKIDEGLFTVYDKPLSIFQCRCELQWKFYKWQMYGRVGKQCIAPSLYYKVNKSIQWFIYIWYV